MLTLEQNIRAVLDSCFSETKDEIKDIAEANIMRLINNAEQTKPIKEIVRCRECKWVRWNSRDDRYECFCHIPIFAVQADGYCNLGEPKGEE